MKKALSVQGMTCEHCVRRVKKIIEKSSAISDVDVSLERKEATFSCDESADIAGIVSAINDFGFTAAEKQ